MAEEMSKQESLLRCMRFLKFTLNMNQGDQNMVFKSPKSFDTATCTKINNKIAVSN